MKLTLEQFIKQWAPGGNATVMGSKLDANVFEFTTLAGETSKAYFKASFLYGGFYDSGKKWERRQSKWGRKFTHPVLLDTATLRDSIKGEGKKISRTGWAHSGKKIFTRGAKYNIWTDEFSKPIKGKRGRSASKYGKYAAIHNTDPRNSDFTVNQYSSRKPVQRQFIGLNKSLDNHVKKFIPVIFRGFPNA